MLQKLKDNNSSFKLKIAFGMLVFAIIAGLSTVTDTALAANTNSQNEQVSFFDPFELAVYSIDVSEDGSDATISVSAGIAPQANLEQDTAIIVRPQIRVPYRPPFRSPFRPPWTHPPTAPWYPGAPPWNP